MFLPPCELSTSERLARLATLGLLIQRLALEDTPEGKDFVAAVGSVIASEAGELSAMSEKRVDCP